MKVTYNGAMIRLKQVNPGANSRAVVSPLNLSGEMDPKTRRA